MSSIDSLTKYEKENIPEKYKPAVEECEPVAYKMHKVAEMTYTGEQNSIGNLRASETPGITATRTQQIGG